MTEVSPILNDQDFGSTARILNLQAPATDNEPLRRGDGVALLFSKTLGATASEIIINTGDVSSLGAFKRLKVEVECEATGTGDLYLFVNTDNTLANYRSSISGLAAGYSFRAEDSPIIGYCVNGEISTASLELSLTFDSLQWMSNASYYSAGSTVRAAAVCTGAKNAAVTSITSLRVAPAAGSLITDSTMRVYGVPV